MKRAELNVVRVVWVTLMASLLYWGHVKDFPQKQVAETKPQVYAR